MKFISKEQAEKLHNIFLGIMSETNTNIKKQNNIVKTLIDKVSKLKNESLGKDQTIDGLLNILDETLKKVAPEKFQYVLLGIFLEHTIRSLTLGEPTNIYSFAIPNKQKMDREIELELKLEQTKVKIRTEEEILAGPLKDTPYNDFRIIISKTQIMLKQLSDSSSNLDLGDLIKITPEELRKEILNLNTNLDDVTVQKEIKADIRAASFIVKSFEGEIPNIQMAWIVALATTCKDEYYFILALLQKLGSMEIVAKIGDKYNMLDMLYAMDEAMLEPGIAAISTITFNHEAKNALEALGILTENKRDKVSGMISETVDKVTDSIIKGKKKSVIVQDVMTNYISDPKLLSYIVVQLTSKLMKKDVEDLKKQSKDVDEDSIADKINKLARKISKL